MFVFATHLVIQITDPRPDWDWALFVYVRRGTKVKMQRATNVTFGFERKLLCSTRVGYNVQTKTLRTFTRQNSTTSDSDNTGSPPPGPKSRTSELADNKDRPKSAYPPRPEKRPIRLRGRIDGLVKVAPDSAHIPIDTSLPPLIFPDGTPLNRPNALRPPYLTEQLARHLSIHVNDPYMITRSIELFGSPRSSRWVANLTVGASRNTIANRTSNFLRALPWHHSHVKPLVDAAWAEHLDAMQSPRLRYGPDDMEYQDKEQVTNPPWPTDTPSPQDLGLSWSSSAERDVPYTRHPQQRAYLPPGKQTFPRPKRIDRFYPWDDHLIVVFASPAARRAVMAAYAWWMRLKVVDAYRERDLPEKPIVLPPVSVEELLSGEVPIGSQEREALSWARESGWRPEYRIRPYRGRRKKNDDGEGWYQTEMQTRKRVRERKRELGERARLEEGAERRGVDRKGSEVVDLDSEEPDLDKR
ncbi:unnamed protein product [Rhizoctonia solani]|uniref:Uncharacterized protein n=1 Tax=Rhizoctonia solani TaxID=456999 RepID=A0A8H3HJI5_9AGAM|nr:unnamed protein product [Rhizoctonia solani]